MENQSCRWHTVPVRVYYEDTDAQGVVYFANYLRFMERGRTELLRDHGVEQDTLLADDNLCFSLINTNVRFLRPARFNDELEVRTRVVSAAGARVRFEQAIYRATDNETDDEQLLCSAECDAAALAADSFKPRRLPPGLISMLAEPA